MFPLKLSQPLAGEVGLSIYIFGYRDDVPFAQMPKIHIKLGAVVHEIHDQKKFVPVQSIEVKRRDTEIELRVPLKMVGDPQRILTNAQTYLGRVPLDLVSWRALEISP